MNHVHRICRSLASLTKRAGLPLACRAAEPAAAPATQPGPPRRTTQPPLPARSRTITTSKPRVGGRPGPPRERLRTRVLPARLLHAIQLCVRCRGQADRVLDQLHRRPDSAPTLVPVLLPGIGP